MIMIMIIIMVCEYNKPVGNTMGHCSRNIFASLPW
jgi:hypothetical protein